MTTSTPHQLCNSRVERVVRKVTEGTLCITNCNLVVVVLGDFVLLLSQERHRPYMEETALNADSNSTLRGQ